MEQLTDPNFDSFIKSKKLAIVDFWADWCYPCKIASPVFEELSKEFKGKMEFAKMDTQANPTTPAKFNIFSIPTFLVFKNGELAGEIHGALPKAAFKERIEEFL